MAEIPPAGPGRSHGTELTDPRHAAALGTAIRYHTAAGMAAQRALRTFLAHRKAVKDGLVAAATRTRTHAAPAAAVPANQNCTNEFPADTPEPEPHAIERANPRLGRRRRPCRRQPATRTTARTGRRRGLAGRGAGGRGRSGARGRAAPGADAGQARQVRRPSAPPPCADRADLVGDDPVAYEEWFARQPKPPRNPAKSLTAADAAVVERVTRHNPPWIRGHYLGYHRPPVPAHLFLPGATGDEPPPRPLPRPRRRADAPLPRPARTGARLLDRSQPRLAEELDLAEAICAVKWPNWPDYRGPLDLDLLRLALDPVPIDATTLHWLDSHELARACREGGANETKYCYA